MAAIKFHNERPSLDKPFKFKGHGSSKFQPLPAPSGASPYRLNLEDVIGKVTNKNKMVFQTCGDTGGVKHPQAQQNVKSKMEEQFYNDSKEDNPLFFYHLGDVVYFYGEKGEYNNQFFDPYMYYPAPILAIPGNHDGDIDPTDSTPPTSLDAFVKVFCDTKPTKLDIAGDAERTSMIQPNVYWTLQTPMANIIGLYTNVPEHGEIDDDQKQWFYGELKNAQKERKEKAIIVALHHPVFSVDHHHGSSGVMKEFLDTAFDKTGVIPDLILTAHVHNYQRFTRDMNGHELPYIVAGAGGYWHLHTVDSKADPIYVPNSDLIDGVVMEEFCDDRHGFLRISLENNNGKRTLIGEYFTVPRSTESSKDPAEMYDYFRIDLKTNKISNTKRHR
jgi:acid phosphatase type 7